MDTPTNCFVWFLIKTAIHLCLPLFSPGSAYRDAHEPLSWRLSPCGAYKFRQGKDVGPRSFWGLKRGRGLERIWILIEFTYGPKIQTRGLV